MRARCSVAPADPTLILCSGKADTLLRRPCEFLGEINHLANVMVSVCRHALEHAEASFRIRLGGIRVWQEEIRFGLTANSGGDHGNRAVEIGEDLFFR